MLKFKIRPVLGLKTDVPADDPSLFTFITDNEALTHDVGGQNVDYETTRNACSKCLGYTDWSNSARGTTDVELGSLELDDGTNRDNIVFDGGSMFYYDGSKDPVEMRSQSIFYSVLSGTVDSGETVTGDTTATVATVGAGKSSATGSVNIYNITGGTGNYSAAETLTFSGGATANCDSVITYLTFRTVSSNEPYSAIQYGSYIVFSDGGTAVMHKWTNGDDAPSYLITNIDGAINRQYKFKYLIEWYNHIIGLNETSLDTNGDLSIRWTDVFPSWTDFDFPLANQIYKPSTDSITGVSKMGVDALLVYGTTSISKMQYYPGASTLFGIIPLVPNHGCASHASIVNAYGSNWFFNKDYGFVRYSGGSVISDVISSQIESTIEDIPASKYAWIIGKHLPRTQEIVWLIPSTQDMPDSMLYYSVRTGGWRKETKSAFVIDVWTQATDEAKKMISIGNGDVYEHSGNDFDTADYQGFRVEPIMDFGHPSNKKFLSELWFGIVSGGTGINIFHRSGDTVKEVIATTWQYAGTIDLTGTYDPDPPAFRVHGRSLQLEYDNLAGGAFAIGDTVTGQTEGTVGVITGVLKDTSTTGTIYFHEVSGGDGGFDNNEQIDNGSGVTADCSVSLQTINLKMIARYHQIKWGTFVKDASFTINWIEFRYTMEGDY